MKTLKNILFHVVFVICFAICFIGFKGETAVKFEDEELPVLKKIFSGPKSFDNTKSEKLKTKKDVAKLLNKLLNNKKVKDVTLEEVLKFRKKLDALKLNIKDYNKIENAFRDKVQKLSREDYEAFQTRVIGKLWENIFEEAEKIQNRPINLKVRIVDKEGNPIVGANVSGTIKYISRFKMGKQYKEINKRQADKKGYFSIKGKGTELDFFIWKEGYIGKEYFMKSNDMPKGIFNVTLQKKSTYKGGLVSGSIKFDAKKGDNTKKVGFRFKGSKIVSGDKEADIYFGFERDDRTEVVYIISGGEGTEIMEVKDNKGEKYLSGGSDITAKNMIEAPEEGYIKELRYSKKTFRSYGRDHNYYIKLNEGKIYGKLVKLYINVIDDKRLGEERFYIRCKYYLQLDGSRIVDGKAKYFSSRSDRKRFYEKWKKERNKNN
jgi:hypothetical protein